MFSVSNKGVQIQIHKMWRTICVLTKSSVFSLTSSAWLSPSSHSVRVIMPMVTWSHTWNSWHRIPIPICKATGGETAPWATPGKGYEKKGIRELKSSAELWHPLIFSKTRLRAKVTNPVLELAHIVWTYNCILEPVSPWLLQSGVSEKINK